MQKIPTIFIRDPDTNLRHVKDEPHPACAWVFDGEGVATRKYDGTCVRVGPDGGLGARRSVHPGRETPAGFELVEHDPNTGKRFGWEPAENSPFAKFINEASDGSHVPGTYELCGPKINGNPEGFEGHVLVRHGDDVIDDVPRDFSGLAEWLPPQSFEGIVWHHPDGRMAKIKRRDFPEVTA